MGNDVERKQVKVKIIIDGEQVREIDTGSLLLIDDNGTFSMGIEGLLGVCQCVRETVHHFSKAIIGIDADTPFDIERAKMLQLLEARLTVACMCSAMYSFGEKHGLKKFSDMADTLNEMFNRQIDKIDRFKVYDIED